MDALYNGYKDAKSHYGFVLTMGNTYSPFCIKTAKIKAEYIGLVLAIH
jgi:hypothetical protein